MTDLSAFDDYVIAMKRYKVLTETRIDLVAKITACDNERDELENQMKELQEKIKAVI